MDTKKKVGKMITVLGGMVIIFCLAFWLGKSYESKNILGKQVAEVVFLCKNNRKIETRFYKRAVHIETGEFNMYLPQTISASGARYANDDESIIFWNKGNTAFIDQGGTTTYSDCTTE